jgi:ligand-binding sensor domain-containing protein
MAPAAQRPRPEQDEVIPIVKRLPARAVALAAAIAAVMAGTPARAADLVCAATSSEGLVCLDSTGFKRYSQRSGHLPDDRIADLATCGDTIFIASGEDTLTYDGTRFDRPIKVGRGLVERIACQPQGGFWAASQTALSFWDRTGWKHFDLAAVAAGAGRNLRVRGLAAGPDGAVWATLGEGAVLHFNGTEWKLFRQNQGFRLKHDFGRIAVDRAGQVWLPFAKGLYTWKAEKWDQVRGLAAANFISIDDKNRIWLTSGARVAVLDEGRMREIPTDHNARAVAADANGVIWAATDFGLARYSGTAWESRQMQNSDLADDDLMLIAVLGKGATLPPMISQAKGALAGKTEWSDGQPIAEADVQVCGVRAFDFGIGAGPCDDKPLAAKAKTSADGTFNFGGLAPGNYHFVIRPKGARRWIRFATDPDRLKVKPGEAKAAGTISIDAKQRDPK